MEKTCVNFYGFFVALVIVTSTVASVTTPTKGVIRDTVDFYELSSKCVRSSDFELNSLFWRIEFCKTSNFVNASLVSYLTEDAPKWSCRAEAVFKLHSPLSVKYFEKNMTKQTFDIAHPSHGISEFIDWHEMFENYVHENKSYFEVKILTEPPTRSVQTEQYSTSSVVYIENASTLTSHISPDIVVRGIRWKVEVEKTLAGYLAIHLKVEKDDLGSNESWEVKANFKLNSWSQDTSVTNNYTTRFEKNYISNWGFATFLEWNKFISADNEYIRNDVAWLEVEMTVNEPKLG